MKGVGRELARFTINTTIGMGGLFDPAKSGWGIPASEEDWYLVDFRTGVAIRAGKAVNEDGYVQYREGQVAR